MLILEDLKEINDVIKELAESKWWVCKTGFWRIY